MPHSKNRPLIYSFGPDLAATPAGATPAGATPAARTRELLGGKGANLAEMASLGLPVPAGFTLTTEVCRYAMHHGGALPSGLRRQLDAALERVEAAMGRRFGAGDDPLLLSVRSGAPVSMPGMMDTVLDIGLNDTLVEALARSSGDARFAWDCYRRFVQMYANVVLGLDDALLEDQLTRYREARGAEADRELGAEDWRALVGRFKAIVRRELDREIPDEPREQLWDAIRAVFASWDNRRARHYRRLHGISDEMGTAVNVMAMVYGNRGADSASGVAFTRNPATGERQPYGEYLLEAQGEDVVAGVRTPAPINRVYAGPHDGQVPLSEQMPHAYRELDEIFHRLEGHYRDMQDVEFTIEARRVWILQTRTGKRTGLAAVKIALDMLDENLIDEQEALLRVDARHHLAEMLHPAIDPAYAPPMPLARGLAASPGAAVGKVVFDPDEAVRLAEAGEAVVLVRRATSADDIHGLYAARGILTQTGGLTSHAAVVARGLGRPCVCGVSAIDIERAESGVDIGFRVGEMFIEKGDVITLDGTRGAVYLGALPVVEATTSDELERFMEIVDRHRTLHVRANADTPDDARKARRLGAEGIGLCRTEHMFFATDERLTAMRAAIMADPGARRDEALARLRAFQREDFVEILRAMGSLPVTVRLLDPPLHEFLPEDAHGLSELARLLGMPADEVRRRAARMRETNPMLGFRGCRIAIAFPELYDMQVGALVEATIAVLAEGARPQVEIMVPFVAEAAELEVVRALIETRVSRLTRQADVALDFHIGTMIELPRAVLTADRIAHHADFFSFGTNDLTQTVFGLSRDDAGRFLPEYLERRLLDHDPFVSIDRPAVGELMRIGTERGRASHPGLVIGLCGEHGGDPPSVELCHRLGFDYVSCSAFRVPIARLAAAQAAVREAQELRRRRRDDAGRGARL